MTPFLWLNTSLKKDVQMGFSNQVLTLLDADIKIRVGGTTILLSHAQLANNALVEYLNIEKRQQSPFYKTQFIIGADINATSDVGTLCNVNVSLGEYRLSISHLPWIGKIDIKNPVNERSKP